MLRGRRDPRPLRRRGPARRRPDGKYTLFDEGRELRVVSLADQQIEGVAGQLRRDGNFTTLALFSPDGKTILTNGAAAGRLQLWRAPIGRRSAPPSCGSSSGATGTVDLRGVRPGRRLRRHRHAGPQGPGLEDADRRGGVEHRRGRAELVEGFLDTSIKRVSVWADLDNATAGHPRRGRDDRRAAAAERGEVK